MKFIRYFFLFNLLVTLNLKSVENATDEKINFTICLDNEHQDISKKRISNSTLSAIKETMLFKKTILLINTWGI